MRDDFSFVRRSVFFWMLMACMTMPVFAQRPMPPNQTCYWAGDQHAICAEEATREKLDQELGSKGFSFEDAPLEEIAEFLRKEYDLNIHIDEVALDDLGLDKTEPITASFVNISLKTAIKKMLEPLELTYYLEEDLFIITSEDETLVNLRVVIYPVADLVWVEGEKNLHYDELLDTVVQTIESDTWAENGGGEAEITPYTGFFIISQTEVVHTKLIYFFEALRRSDQHRYAKPKDHDDNHQGFAPSRR